MFLWDSPHIAPLYPAPLPQAEVRFRDCGNFPFTHCFLHLWLLWAVSHFGLFDGTPCGAKPAHINLHFVWIFRYSCLWHGDSSWCAWAPQISQCHAWTEAAASGPRQAQPALAGPSRPRISPNPTGDTLYTRVVKDSINTFSSLQQTHDDTFSMSLQWRWNSWIYGTKKSLKWLLI